MAAATPPLQPPKKPSKYFWRREQGTSARVKAELGPNATRSTITEACSEVWSNLIKLQGKQVDKDFAKVQEQHEVEMKAFLDAGGVIPPRSKPGEGKRSRKRKLSEVEVNSASAISNSDFIDEFRRRLGNPVFTVMLMQRLQQEVAPAALRAPPDSLQSEPPSLQGTVTPQPKLPVQEGPIKNDIKVATSSFKSSMEADEHKGFEAWLKVRWSAISDEVDIKSPKQIGEAGFERWDRLKEAKKQRWIDSVC